MSSNISGILPTRAKEKFARKGRREDDEGKYSKARHHKLSQNIDGVVLGLIGLALFWTYLILTDTRGPEKVKLVRSPTEDSLIIVDEKTWRTEPYDDELEILVETVEALDAKVRDVKSHVDSYMEVDSEGKGVVTRLQDATRKLLHKRYGKDVRPYLVKLLLLFPRAFQAASTKGNQEEVTIELASSMLMPHAIFTFLEIARDWPYKGGGFHRFEDHLLQVNVKSLHMTSVAFQEYSEDYPHKVGTVGFGGRPSGPKFYINLKDNTKVHGPGSMPDRNPYEAEPCFGKVIYGWESVERMTKIPTRGFVNDERRQIKIQNITIHTPDENGGYRLWVAEPYDVQHFYKDY